MLHFGSLTNRSTSARAINKHLNYRISAAMVLTLVSVFVAATAFARIVKNTIDLKTDMTPRGIKRLRKDFSLLRSK